MSDDSYHPPPVTIPIPQSSDIRTYYFNWRITRSLVHPFNHTNVRHIREYHPLLCTASSPFYTVQCAGSHRFDFLSPDHGYPFLVVQFTILPFIHSHLPLTYTTPHNINSCPVIYVLWRDLPFYPPLCDLEALELPADEVASLDFIKDFLQQFIQYYYSPLAPYTTPLEHEQ